MNKTVIAAALLCLSGCATFGQLEIGLNGLVGQDLRTAVSIFGFPTSERQIAGMRLVEWGRSGSATVAMPTSSTTTGYIQSGTASATYAATTNSSVPMTFSYNCRISLQVDASNIIRNYQYGGDVGGCEPYIRALKKNAIAVSMPAATSHPMREEI